MIFYVYFSPFFTKYSCVYRNKFSWPQFNFVELSLNQDDHVNQLHISCTKSCHTNYEKKYLWLKTQVDINFTPL